MPAHGVLRVIAEQLEKPVGILAVFRADAQVALALKRDDVGAVLSDTSFKLFVLKLVQRDQCSHPRTFRGSRIRFTFL
jgi:hypothetical protein